MIEHTPQDQRGTWPARDLFQPATWSRACYAPFLDVLGEYLAIISKSTYTDEQVKSALNRKLSWVHPEQDLATCGVTRCDHVVGGHTHDAQPCALNDLIPPRSSELSPIRASALLPPEPSSSGPPTDTMTSAGSAAQSSSSSGAAFTGQNTPVLSLSAYVHRLARYSGCSAACFLYALSYILRIRDQGTVVLNEGSVHRLLLTAVVVAIKVIEDQCFVNMHYAEVGGVTLSDLNQMELTMCALLDFRFNMADDDASTILKQISCTLGQPVGKLGKEQPSGGMQSEAAQDGPCADGKRPAC